MLYVIFSDIHSNLQAYESLINDLKKKKPDKCLCLGDIVGYGANPKECIGLTKKLNCPVICGNHDLASAGKIPTTGFNASAKKAIN
jgi:predicted phosphodiesterase